MDPQAARNRIPIKEEGTYINELREGFFEQTFDNDDKFYGYYRRNIKEGEWREVYSSGNVFQGSLRNGVEEGEWQIRYWDGTLAFGKFVQGVQQGEWTMKYHNGNLAIGQVKDGIKVGRWKMICEGQNFFTEFENGKYDIFKSNAGFSGQFNRGMKNGLWIFWPRYGLQYTTNYENDVKHGPHTQLINGEFHQCLYEKGQIARESVNLGQCQLVNTKNEVGFVRNGVKVGFWKLMGDPFYDVQQNEMQNYEFGEFVDGIKEGKWTKVIYLSRSNTKSEVKIYKNGDELVQEMLPVYLDDDTQKLLHTDDLDTRVKLIDEEGEFLQIKQQELQK